MSPTVSFDECSSPYLGSAGVGHLLGPWMPMAGAATDGFDQCETPAVTVEECSTAAVSIVDGSISPVTFTEGGL